MGAPLVLLPDVVTSVALIHPARIELATFSV